MTHRIYDDRDDPKNLSTSIATRSYQNRVQFDDVVGMKDDVYHPLGIVAGVAGQDDDEALDDTHAVPEGMARVWFIPGTRQYGKIGIPPTAERDQAYWELVEIESLVVVDRAFCRSTAVSPYPKEGAKTATGKDGFNSLRQGIVCDVDLKVIVRVGGREVEIHSSQLSRLHPRTAGAFTGRLDVLESMKETKALPRLRAVTKKLKEPADRAGLALCSNQGVHFDVVCHFPSDGSVCVIFGEHIEVLLDEVWRNGCGADNMSRFARNIDFFYPSQVLACPSVFRHQAHYIHGKFKASHKKGTVLRVVPYLLSGNLLVAPEHILESLADNRQELRLKGMKKLIACERALANNESESDAAGDAADEPEEEQDGDGGGGGGGRGAAAPAEGAGLSKKEQRRERRRQLMEEHDEEAELEEEEVVRLGMHPSLTRPVTCFSDESYQFGDTGLVSEEVLQKAGRGDKSVMLELLERNPPPAAPRLYPAVPGAGLLLGRREVEKFNHDHALQRQRAAEYKGLLLQKSVRQVIESERRRTVLVVGTERFVKVQWQDGKVSDWIPSKELFTLLHTQAFDHFPGDFVTPVAVPVLKYVRDNPAKRENAALSCYDLEGAWNGSDYGVGDLVLWCPRGQETERAKRMQRHGSDAPSRVAPKRPAVRPWVCSRCTLMNVCGLVCRACGLIKVMAKESVEPAADNFVSTFVESLGGVVLELPQAGAAAAAPAAEPPAAPPAGAEAETAPDAATPAAPDAPAADGTPREDQTEPLPLNVMQFVTCGGVHARVAPFSAVAEEEKQSGMTPKPSTERGGVIGIVKSVNPKARVARVDWTVIDTADEPEPLALTMDLMQTLSSGTGGGMGVRVYEPETGTLSHVCPSQADAAPPQEQPPAAAGPSQPDTTASPTPDGSQGPPTAPADETPAPAPRLDGLRNQATLPKQKLSEAVRDAARLMSPNGEGSSCGLLSSDLALLSSALNPAAAQAPPPNADEDRMTFLTPADHMLVGVVTKVSPGAKLTVNWYEWDRVFVEDDVDVTDCIFIDFSDVEDFEEEEEEEEVEYEEDEEQEEKDTAAAAASPAGEGGAEGEPAGGGPPAEAVVVEEAAVEVSAEGRGSPASGGGVNAVDKAFRAAKGIVKSIFGGTPQEHPMDAPGSVSPVEGGAAKAHAGEEEEEEDDDEGAQQQSCPSAEGATAAQGTPTDEGKTPTAELAQEGAAQPADKPDATGGGGVDGENGGGGGGGAAADGKAAAEGAQVGAEEEEEEDDEEEGPFQVISEFTEHLYLAQAADQLNMRRVESEWKAFHKSLPPGIKVVASETQPHLLMALIDGPDHTPYRNSPYVFYLNLTGMFPLQPPKAKCHTFGYRLNPNLYADGYICLSLLGTWDGQQTCEEWRSESTLLQVLISIQGLVLTKEPYYNEAGYHNHLGTAEGRQNSKAYNEQVYLLTLRYLTRLIRSPPLHLKAEIDSFVKREWEGTVQRAEEYILDGERRLAEEEAEDDDAEDACGAAGSAVDLPAAEPQAQPPAASSSSAGGGAAPPSGKRIITPEELARSSSVSLNQDGLILPVSIGFTVSLSTTVLPELKEALADAGYVPKQATT